ncbi:MAG TPA: gamma-glutamyltransferase [Geminicoccaceae bacterium]|nr:gamma-glutamyltransferase [Geminicoccaceae bacterium]
MDRQQNWVLRKPAARGAGGVVASQHHLAAEVGAAVLRDGGNAVDAAIATAFAVSVLEPWMSGVGGGGMMLVHSAAERRVRAFAFGMVAPLGLDPADYPLGPAEEQAGGLFPWPSVVENRNVYGPLSIAVPGHVAGLGLAHERFATRPWAELLAPAVALAEEGLPVSWHATLKIAASARDLRRFEPARDTYLPNGLPPVPNDDGTLPRRPLGRLAVTLGRLAEAGPRDFYEGEIARALVDDVRAIGGRLAAEDLARYRAFEADAPTVRHGGATVHTAPGLTAGPTLCHALGLIGDRVPAGEPGADAYRAWAEGLFAAYERRLATMGDVDDSRAPACTTHLSAADADGNLVSLTQTLLSSFGSKVISPQTGVLLNNGIMWFDPRPGGPNAMAPGKRPLSNMCPVVATRGDGGEPWFALGASGGRRILPAVLQVASMLAACGLSAEEAMHRPRIDVSGTEALTADPRLPAEVLDALEARYPAAVRREHAVYPSLFACPSIAVHGPADAGCLGLADPMNPVAGAAG